MKYRGQLYSIVYGQATPPTIGQKKAVLTVKTKVETGVRNENMVEICSGINKGDVVVWNENSEITDGMSVKVNK